MSVYIILLTFMLMGISFCNGYRVLAIFPFSGRSHVGVLDPIVKELARKGHQVDVISNFPLKEPFPNYTDIITLSNGIVSMNYEKVILAQKEQEWLIEKKTQICDLLGHPEISKLIKNPPTNPSYDLLLIHMVFGYQCFTAIGHEWDLPVVGIVTTRLYPQMLHFIGNPLNLAISSYHLGFYKENMDFWDKLYNVIMTQYRIQQYYYNHGDRQDYYIKKYLGADMPSYRELETSIALILSNSHFSYYGIKPRTPALVEIGGINIKNDTTPLDPGLKRILDESKDGFIYFSFGSLMALESLPNEVLEKFYEAIRKLSPFRVIMKMPNPDAMPKNVPKNIITFSWLPQQKILQHHNIKGFVSHGGALGTQEAVYYKVPMICVPFFADQYVNCDILSIKKVALKLDTKTAQQKDYDYVFHELLSNPIYKESVRKFSSLYWDRPQSPKEEATYWIEYVIRHGKNALRSPAVGMRWWQVELLDIYGFLLLCAIIISFIIISIVRLVFTLILRKLRFIRVMKSSKKLN